MRWEDLRRAAEAPTGPDVEIDFAIADPARRPGERFMLAVIARGRRMTPADLVAVVDGAIEHFGSPAKALLMLNLGLLAFDETWH